MKAMVKKSLADDAPLVLSEFESPEPGTGQVRVAVKSIGVNPVDWKLLSNPAAVAAQRVLGRSSAVFAGIDFAGIIEKTGQGVSWVKAGDTVVGATRFFLGERGSYADTVVVGESQVCKLPDNFDIVAAGALPIAGVTAWQAVVESSRLKKGQRALILGASGGVGHLALQIAKHVCGAFTVGVCSGKNTAFVQSLGADVVVDYTKGDALKQARLHGPYQVVVDCVGDYPGAGCRALLAPKGRHVNIAPQSASAIVQPFLSPLKSRMLIGFPTGAKLKLLVDAVATDRIKVIISEQIPLKEANRAHMLSQSGRVTGKLVLVP